MLAQLTQLCLQSLLAKAHMQPTPVTWPVQCQPQARQSQLCCGETQLAVQHVSIGSAHKASIPCSLSAPASVVVLLSLGLGLSSSSLCAEWCLAGPPAHIMFWHNLCTHSACYDLCLWSCWVSVTSYLKSAVGVAMPLTTKEASASS